MFCCDTCGAGITFAKELPDGTAEECNREESIGKWNTRKIMDDIVEQLEDIADMHRDLQASTKLSFEDRYRHTLLHGLSLKMVDIVRNGGKEHT